MEVVDWIIKDGYKESGDIGDYLKRLEMFFAMMYLLTRCTCSHDGLAHMMDLLTLCTCSHDAFAHWVGHADLESIQGYTTRRSQQPLPLIIVGSLGVVHFVYTTINTAK